MIHKVSVITLKIWIDRSFVFTESKSIWIKIVSIMHLCIVLFMTMIWVSNFLTPSCVKPTYSWNKLEFRGGPYDGHLRKNPGQYQYFKQKLSGSNLEPSQGPSRKSNRYYSLYLPSIAAYCWPYSLKRFA